MLVLERYVGESVFLPEVGVTITLNRIKYHDHKIRLAIEAPPGVTIIREELATPKQRKMMERR